MAVEIDGTSKGLLGAFAVFVLGSGIASLVYGIFLLLRYVGIEFNYGNFNLFSISILLIVVGGLLILTVVMGVIGALKDLAKVRLVTVILLFILFAILAVVGVWGMISFKTGRLAQSIDLDIKRLNEQKDSNLNEMNKKKADYLNRKYNCCGVYSTYDTRASDVAIPESCCITPGCGGGSTMSNTPQYFENGCATVYLKTKAAAVFHLSILALVAAGLVLLALIIYAVLSQRARAGYAVVARG